MGEQHGFFVDTTRCVKCYSCEIACQQWHGFKAATLLRRKVHETCEGTFPTVRRTFASFSCMHCEEPACVSVCPAQAVEKRASDGIVITYSQKCIGCRSCSLACPFDVPQYEEPRRTMDKCDACDSLGRKNGEEPHCVASCPTKALRFGRMSQLKILAEQKEGALLEGVTKPSVYLAFRK